MRTEKLINELAETKTYASICSTNLDTHIHASPKPQAVIPTQLTFVQLQMQKSHLEVIINITDSWKDFLGAQSVREIEEYLKNKVIEENFMKLY